MHEWRDADALRELYVGRALSTVECARELGCTHKCIRTWLRRHGIPARGMAEAQANEIARGKPRGHAPWRHGVRPDGYRGVSSRGGSRLDHRAIAAAVLGRNLSDVEVVHHCNGCRVDNRPANLWIFPSQSSHVKYHANGIIHPDTIVISERVLQ